MNNRIRMVRDELNLTRAAFGAKLGVSGDVINNLERGRVEAKESIIKLICSVYSVDEKWLRTGEGEKFRSVPDAQLTQIVSAFDLDELDQRIILGYLRLSESDRATVKRLINSIAAPAMDTTEQERTVEDTAGQERTEPDLAAEVAELKRQNQALAAEIAAMKEEDRDEQLAADFGAALSALQSGLAGSSEKTKK